MQTTTSNNAEIFKAVNEPFAQGFFEEPKRSYLYRFSNAYRRFWENAALVPYDGKSLYPCGLNLKRTTRDDGMALIPNYSYTFECKWSLLRSKAPAEAVDALYADLDKIGGVPPPHYVGGGGFTHGFINYKRILTEGLSTYRKRVQALPEGDFRDALLVVLDGIDTYRKRSIAMLIEASAPKRLIDALSHVPEYQPRDIYEAMVAWNFLYYVDGCDNIGPLDRNLLPYYKGENIVELLKEFYDHVNINDAWSGTLGPDYNDITLQCLEAICGSRRPNTQLLVKPDMPDAVWEGVYKAIASGCGQPSLYNYEGYMAGLREKFPEVPEEDWARLSFGGCTETMLEGISNVGSDDAGINFGLILDEAIREDLPSSPDFEAFYKRLLERSRSIILQWLTYVNEFRERRAKYRPHPIRTLFIDDCIDTMREFNDSGARWTWSCINICGVVNGYDSLPVIRELIFERKLYTADEFIKKMDERDAEFLRNAEGCHHYGSDDPIADELAARLTDDLTKILDELPCYPKGKFIPVSNQFINYTWAGEDVRATPDGRAAGEPLADSLAPIHGHDSKGPTALLNSVAAVHTNKFLGTPIVNFRMRKEHVKPFLKPLVQSYFARGGLQLQISCISREDMLDAMEHPENHKNLIVRIGGYSEYFNRLSDELKQTVIKRTEY